MDAGLRYRSVSQQGVLELSLISDAAQCPTAIRMHVARTVFQDFPSPPAPSWLHQVNNFLPRMSCALINPQGLSLRGILLPGAPTTTKQYPGILPRISCA